MSYLGYLHFQISWAFTCFRPSLFGHRNMDNLQSLTLEYANAMTFFVLGSMPLVHLSSTDMSSTIPKPCMGHVWNVHNYWQSEIQNLLVLKSCWRRLWYFRHSYSKMWYCPVLASLKTSHRYKIIKSELARPIGPALEVPNNWPLWQSHI